MKTVSFTTTLLLFIMSSLAYSQDSLSDFMDVYQKEIAVLYRDANLAWWDAAVTGTDEAFKKQADAALRLETYHSDPAKFAKLKKLRADAIASGKLSPIALRAAEVAELAFEQKQIAPDLIEKMTQMQSELEQVFQTQRPKVDGKEYTNNELLEMLETENDSAKRQKIWEGLKEVGEQVNDRLIALAKVRNEAAKKLGYDNYWQMSVRFQDFNADELLAIFDDLERTTRPLFADMKRDLDNELAVRFGISADKLMAWHYDNPFFQQAPPSKEVNPSDFYEHLTKEQIAEISVVYYKSIGMPEVTKILAKSSLYEQPGKSQHAFSTDIDASGDVRILCNLKPTAEWMDTQLHELGHSVDAYNIDRSLPYNLRTNAHIFTTEGVAMYFGAKARTPEWMIKYVGTEPSKANAVADALKRQRRREQLIFCRWVIVMLNFEKALYENPDADLRTLWWDMVEKYQMIKRPADRNKADWASKPHFTIAPVYYHNYMLGELFAAQIRKSIGKQTGTDFGNEMKAKVFKPGASHKWQKFVEQATGEALSTKAFADELN
jgi:peptidyl-dipeptidase A